MCAPQLGSRCDAHYRTDVYVCMCMCVCVCVYVYVCMCMCVCVCVYVYVFVCRTTGYVRVRVSVCARHKRGGTLWDTHYRTDVYKCICMCMCVCVCASYDGSF